MRNFRDLMVIVEISKTTRSLSGGLVIKHVNFFICLAHKNVMDFPSLPKRSPLPSEATMSDTFPKNPVSRWIIIFTDRSKLHPQSGCRITLNISSSVFFLRSSSCAQLTGFICAVNWRFLSQLLPSLISLSRKKSV